MDKNKVLDFFDYLKNDKESAEKFKTITEKLSTVKNEESAKKLLEEELIPFAKSKGYDITYEDFLNFTKTQETELSDDILEMASGGRSEFWNRIGQSLLIFGTGAGLFAGATFSATGGFGGGKSKSSDNRPAAVQTVDQNRTKSSINNIKKEFQDRNKGSEIDKELSTKAKDDTYVSSNKTKSNRSFRNTVARANKGANTKARGAYLNKADNLEIKSRVNANKVSNENKKIAKDKNKETKKNEAEKVAIVSKDTKVDNTKGATGSETNSLKKTDLPNLDTNKLDTEENTKNAAEKYLDELNTKVLKNSASTLRTLFSFGFSKKWDASNASLADILEIVSNLNKLKTSVLSNVKNDTDKNKIIKEIDQTISKFEDAIKNGFTNATNKYSSTKWNEVINKEKFDETIKEMEDLVGKKNINNLEKVYASATTEAVNFKKIYDDIVKAKKDFESCVTNFSKITSKIKEICLHYDVEDVKKIIKDLSGALTALEKNNYIGAKEDVADIMNFLQILFKRVEYDNILLKIREIKDKGDLTKIKKAYENLKDANTLLNTINNSKYVKSIIATEKLIYFTKIGDYEYLLSVLEKMGKLKDLLEEKKFSDSEIKNIPDIITINDLKSEISTAIVGIESGDLFDTANKVIKKLEDRYLELIKDTDIDTIIVNIDNYSANGIGSKLERLAENKDNEGIVNLFEGLVGNKNWKSSEENFKNVFSNKKFLEYVLSNTDTFNNLIKKHEKVIKEVQIDKLSLAENTEMAKKGIAYKDALSGIIDNAIKSDGVDAESIINFVKACYEGFSNKKYNEKDFVNVINNENFKNLLKVNCGSTEFDNFKSWFNNKAKASITTNNVKVAGALEDILNMTKDNRSKALQDLVNGGNFEIVSAHLGRVIKQKNFEDAYTIIDTAFKTTSDKTTSGFIGGYKYDSKQFLKLINNEELFKYLEEQAKKDESARDEVFKKFKELFNEKGESSIKGYLTNTASVKGGENTTKTVEKLSKIFNAKEAEQEELKKLVTEGSYTEENLKEIVDKLKEKAGKNDIENVYLIVNEAYNTTGKSKGKKFTSDQFAQILNGAKGELVELLSDENVKKSNFYNNFKELFNKSGTKISYGGIKAYLGEDKVVELDDVLNYSGTDGNIINARLERDKRLAKSKNFEAIKNRLNNALNKKENQNVMEIVKAATNNIGIVTGYSAADVAKIIENSELRKYLENSDNKDQELYKDFRKYFNEILKVKLGTEKLAKDLDARLNPYLSGDIERLGDKNDLRDKRMIDSISGLLGDRIKEAKDDARELDNVLKIIDTVYNDTGGRMDASKTFGVDEFTTLIKENCDGLVGILNENKDTDFYKNLKTILEKAIKGGWINDKDTSDKLSGI